jgi:membrane protein DedA with SNARE-associated domain
MEPKAGLLRLRKKAPHIIIACIVIIVAAYVLFILLEDAGATGASSIDAIIAFSRNVTDTISSWGYLGVFILMLIEATSFPIPSEVILPFAGYLVSTGHLAFMETIIVATVAGIAGSLIDYYIGLKGVDVLTKHKLLGKIILSNNQLEVAAHWFNKYGSIMVFLGRLIPAFRTLISIPAGCVKMSLTKFIAFTATGCLIWNSLLVYIGYYLGTNWKEVADVSRYLIITVVAATILIGTVYLIRRQRRKRRNVQQPKNENTKIKQ